MKFLSLLLPLVLFVGCRTAAPQLLPVPAPAGLPNVVVAPPAPAPVVVAPVQASLDQRLKQQRQMIEALMSQNDALTAKLNAPAPAPTPPPAAVPTPVLEVVKVSPPPVAETPRTLPPPPPEIIRPEAAPKAIAVITPNADGVIDLTVATSAANDPVNPFAVRHLPAESAREIMLRISGIIGGTAPAALVNGRAVQAGESVESLTLERCEPDAAIFRRGEHVLRLPIGIQPIRIRVAL